jgi:hypothetical protein
MATTNPQGMVSLPDDLAGLTGLDVDEIVDALAEFGVTVLRGDDVELTPLGRWLTNLLFRQSTPAAEADAAILVDAVSGAAEPDRRADGRPMAVRPHPGRGRP